jgi:predicted nucleic acid-binding protein
MTMAWLFEDEKTKKSEQLLLSLGHDHTAFVPALWTWEVSNVLLVAQRRKRITRAQAVGFLNTLKILPIHIDEKASHVAGETVYELALEQGLSAYDAAYLEIALRRQLPLATLDKKLNHSAKALGIVTFSEDILKKPIS